MGTISARMSRLSLRRELVLTDHDVAVFYFVMNFIIENQWSPTVTEISDGVACSRSAAHNSLHRLSAYGLIEMGEGARTVRVIGSRVDMSEVSNVAR
jgi:predicted transcriptional regulator